MPEMIRNTIEKVHAKIRNSKNKPVRTLVEIYGIYDYQRVPRSAASLSYYIIIALFPVLIITARVLAGLNIPEEKIVSALSVLPEQAASVVKDFLSYVRGENAVVILVVGIGVMLTSTASAFRTLMSIFGDIEGKRRFHGIAGYIFSFVISIAFIAAVYISGIVVLSGEWLRDTIQMYFGVSGFLGMWQWLRYIVMLIVMFIATYLLYIAAAPKGDKFRSRIPGALASSVAMVAVTVIFSRMISASTKYAVVYGSLASVIILLIFCYTGGLVIILGNILNVAIKRVYHNDR